MPIAGATYRDGVAYIDGALCVTPTGSASITGGSGVPILLAQSWVAIDTPADTTEDILATITVPANTLGANGSLRIRHYWSFTNNANNKTLRIRYSGAGGAQYFAPVLTTQVSIEGEVIISNRNATNSQMGVSRALTSTGSNNALQGTTSAVDTTAATTIIFSGQKAVSGDTLRLEGYTVEYMKP
jgi:hypothetical protein